MGFGAIYKMITDIVGGTESLYKVIKWTSKLPLIRGFAFSVRDKLLAPPVGSYHEKFAHQLRTFSLFCAQNASVMSLTDEANLGSPQSTSICDSASRVMEIVIGLRRAQEIHCSLKVLVPDEDPEAVPKVCVVARSDRGLRGRPKNLGNRYANPVTQNTAFASILGADDGHTKWQAAFPSFSCNQIQNENHRFQCGRDRFSHYYCSTLAFPIRFHVRTDDDPTHIGFLTFDTQEENGFPGVPNTFAFLHDGAYHSSRYHSECKKSPIWCTGAMMADTLAACMIPHVDTTKRTTHDK